MPRARAAIGVCGLRAAQYPLSPRARADARLSPRTHTPMKKTAILTAAIGGLLLGSAATTLASCSKETPASGAGKAEVAKHACAKMNSCKGQGGCKTGDGGCSGKNTCSAKGGC